MLDSLTATAEIAVGVLKLRSAYSGSSMRVRRSSDNTEQDIGFDGSGNLDTAALLTFAGSGSAYVKTWYDQSGNGRNLTNATAGEQPRIVNAGALETLGKNIRPGIFFDGTDDGLLSSSVSRSQPYSRAICGRTMASPAAIQDIIASNSYGSPSLMVGPTGNFYMAAGTTSLISDASVQTAGAIGKDWTVVERYNGTSSFGDVNGVSRGSSPGTGASTGMNLGGGMNGGTSTKMGVVLYFHSLLSDTDTNTITAFNNAYFGVTGYTLTVTPRAFTATGQTQTLRRNYALSATSRSYGLATANANLLRNYGLAVTTGAYAATAASATIAKKYVLSATAQAFSAAAQNVSLLVNRRLTANLATVAVQTNSVPMTIGNALAVTPAAFAAEGRSVSLFRAYRLFCTAAAVSVSPNPANVLYGRKLSVTKASFAAQTNSANLNVTIPNHYTLSVTPAAFGVMTFGVDLNRPNEVQPGGTVVWRTKGRR